MTNWPTGRSCERIGLSTTNSPGEDLRAQEEMISQHQKRAQIAIAVLSPDRVHGTISRLAAQYAISRETVYTLAAQAKRRLLTGMEPEGHGPVVKERVVSVDRNRLARGVVILSEVGVSQRDVSLCLEEQLDTEPSAAWVNAELAKLEEVASRVNSQWQPQVTETLSGDEIYSNGSPNLLLVGNDSLYIYALTRQPDCDGQTWGCILLDSPQGSQFSSDGGKGLAAGAKTASVGVHQLDWDHLLRPLWGQAACLEQQAYAAPPWQRLRSGLPSSTCRTRPSAWNSIWRSGKN